jgi:hypothetical protein
MKDAAQVLDVMCDVLVQHMTKGLDEYRVVRAIVIGKNSGQKLSTDDAIAGRDVPGGLRLMRASGDEYELTLT